MNVLDEDTKSLWMETFISAASRFSGQERADVGVVGAGIAGLSVAYELAAAGARSSCSTAAESEAE